MRVQGEHLLKQVYGPDARFRPGQWEAIEALVVDHQRALVVQRTGWGKSLVYFMATRLLRDTGSGPTLIVSPLLSLMRNQLQAAEKLGLRAASINSTNTDEWGQTRQAIARDEIDLLLVSPEQLGSEHFGNEVMPIIPSAVGLLVVDEAHCISDWGHDFRPDYRRILRVIRQLPRNVPLLATTATANERVVNDVASQLGPHLRIQRGPLVRRSLYLQTIPLADQAERLAWMAENLPKIPGAGIVYCLTVADCRRVANWLQQQGIDARAYHGQMKNDERMELEQCLLNNQCKALVATVALGMGFDKPDLGFVVHYQRPGSVVAYYQQVGRAGRGVPKALAVLLEGREDNEIHEYFIETAFPRPEDTRTVVQVLDQTGGLHLTQILERVNISPGNVERILKLLQVDEAVGREGQFFFRTPNPVRLDRPEQDQVIRLRRAELARMQAFVHHDGCLMEFIARELDDPHAEPCGRCANCAGDLVPRTLATGMVREAVAYLKRDNQVIKPRKQWPAGGPGGGRKNIAAAEQIAEGRALCVWGDAGWGKLVRHGKYTANRFSDDLVEALASMVQQTWHFADKPRWVTAVPSRKHPDLVPDLARRLAVRLELPFEPVLAKVNDTPPQKEMQNSAQQAANALNAFAIAGRCPAGPVLLVDDIVDSGWTLTVCGALLRRAGSGPVYPVALATAGRGGDTQ